MGTGMSREALEDALRFARPEVIDRNLQREKYARWKVVCSCGHIWHLGNMPISKVAEEVAYNHETHEKEVYFVDGGQRQHRGGIPAMRQE